MLVKKNICDHPECDEEATVSYDIKPNGFFPVKTGQHYELCSTHDKIYFPRGEGWLSKDQSEKIKKELVAS